MSSTTEDAQQWLAANAAPALKDLLLQAVQERPTGDFKAWLKAKLDEEDVQDKLTMKRGTEYIYQTAAGPKTFIIGDKQDMTGKVAMVTGASSGIGYATAKYLAANGLKVVLTARRAEKLAAAVAEIKAAGGEAMAVTMDVTKEEDMAAAFAKVEAEFGGTDAIFANAGTADDLSTPLLDKNVQQLQMVLNTNVLGVMLTAKHGIPALQKRGGGTFIICSSTAALVTRKWPEALAVQGQDGTTWTAYGASKAGADAISRHLHFFMKDNIRTYTINPVFYHSELVERAAGQMGLPASAEGVDLLAGANPICPGSGGDPVDIAKTVLSLIDNSSLYAPNSGIFMDHDHTVNSHQLYKILQDPPTRDETPIGFPTRDEFLTWSKNPDGTDRTDS